MFAYLVSQGSQTSCPVRFTLEDWTSGTEMYTGFPVQECTRGLLCRNVHGVMLRARDCPKSTRAVLESDFYFSTLTIRTPATSLVLLVLGLAGLGALEDDGVLARFARALVGRRLLDLVGLVVKRLDEEREVLEAVLHGVKVSARLVRLDRRLLDHLVDARERVLEGGVVCVHRLLQIRELEGGSRVLELRRDFVAQVVLGDELLAESLVQVRVGIGDVPLEIREFEELLGRRFQCLELLLCGLETVLEFLVGCLQAEEFVDGRGAAGLVGLVDLHLKILGPLELLVPLLDAVVELCLEFLEFESRAFALDRGSDRSGLNELHVEIFLLAAGVFLVTADRRKLGRRLTGRQLESRLNRERRERLLLGFGGGLFGLELVDPLLEELHFGLAGFLARSHCGFESFC
jgi:hypothetical protein